nr:PREDICTED: partner and localizer of BRCA2 [Lepisosteus oculatus]
MASSQSRVDLEAVIESQLSWGRRRRRRRSSSSVRGARKEASPGQDSQGSSPAPPSGPHTGTGPTSSGHLASEPGGSQGALSSPATPGGVATKPKTARVMRPARGKGRGRVPCQKSELGPLPHWGSENPPASGSRGSPGDSHSGKTKTELYPIFQGKCKPANSQEQEHSGLQSIAMDQLKGDVGCSPLARGPCRALRPLSRPSQGSPRLPGLGDGVLRLRSLLSQFDVKDFHLPDEEFGRLKLEKLTMSAAARPAPVAPCASPYYTRRLAAERRRLPLDPPADLWGRCTPGNSDPVESRAQTPGVPAGGPGDLMAPRVAPVQAVLGLSGRRVACSVDTASRQTVDLFSLSERGRPVRTLSLDSAGQSVQALAAVEGETDALIGSTAAAGSIALWLGSEQGAGQRPASNKLVGA